MVLAETDPGGPASLLGPLLDSIPGPAAPVRLARREVIYGCRDNDGAVYRVLSGQVKVVAAARNGKQCLLAVHTAGDVFGELSLAGGSRSETATAMVATMLSRIPVAEVRRGLDEPQLAGALVDHLTGVLAEQQRLITDLMSADSEYRLAAALFRLGDKIGLRMGSAWRLEARLTQEELSGMVGTTRSRIGFFLKRFHAAGLLSRAEDRTLLIHPGPVEAYLAGRLRLS